MRIKYKAYTYQILLLGNGFDLSYKLPTKYICFLQTIFFLKKNISKEFKSVGDIFGNTELQEKCKDIKDSYNLYHAEYDSCQIDKSIIDDMLEKTSGNCWLDLFAKTLAKDVGWIDFEKEIANALKAFGDFFETNCDMFKICDKSAFKTYLDYRYLSKFGGFFSYNYDLNNDCLALKPEYILKEGGQHIKKYANQEKIVSLLENDMQNLSELLKLYMKCFVDAPMEKMVKHGLLKLNPELQNVTDIISFNYTNTFDRIRPYSFVNHIHGNVNNRIVLGVQPGKEDGSVNTDVTFINFKKYYQRTLFDTEDSYIDFISQMKDLKETNEAYAKYNSFEDSTPRLLFVYGHSLDATDKDIIEDLFDIATTIVIFYHNEEAKASYIRNIISIFGKEQYDKLRREKSLTFTSIDNTKKVMNNDQL